MQCDPGQLLHFLISSFSIEAPYGTTCLDTLTIDRSLYGAKKTVCGSLSNIDSDREDFNDGRLYVEFNTNRAINDDGFYIAVTCVRPQFYNIPFPGPEIGDGDMRHRRGTRNVAVRVAVINFSKCGRFFFFFFFFFTWHHVQRYVRKQ